MLVEWRMTDKSKNTKKKITYKLKIMTNYRTMRNKTKEARKKVKTYSWEELGRDMEDKFNTNHGRQFRKTIKKVWEEELWKTCMEYKKQWMQHRNWRKANIRHALHCKLNQLGKVAGRNRIAPQIKYTRDEVKRIDKKEICQQA